MSDARYPPYVDRWLAEAAALAGQPEQGPTLAAARCFEILALFPDHAAAAELAFRWLSGPAFIREMRQTIGRQVDEWDDRPHQHRRRLALSFRLVSRWAAPEAPPVDLGIGWPEDVRLLAEEGRHQLLQDYLVGQTRGAELAWALWQDAFGRSREPDRAMLMAGAQYARHGYFAESWDVLSTLLAGHGGTKTGRRLWAEVGWWRQHEEKLPWLPPRGDGRGHRYRRMMAQIDPGFAAAAPAESQPMAHIPPRRHRLPPDVKLPPPYPVELTAGVEAALADVAAEPQPPGPVDWRYLDLLAAGEVDRTRLPEWAQYLLQELDDPVQELLVMHYVLSQLANPPLDED